MTSSTKIQELREIHQATTPKKWNQLPGRSKVLAGELMGYGYHGIDVATTHGWNVKEARANACFIAQAHEAMPALLAAAELLVYLLDNKDTVQPAALVAYITEKASPVLKDLAES